MRLRFAQIVSFAVPLLTVLPAAAQQTGNGIVINIVQANAAGTSPALLNGYARTVSGQTMQYHSSHPDADAALIVRARRDVPAIAWETDPLPAAPAGDSYSFVWLAGLEHTGWAEDKAPHTWQFLINGERWFIFKNAKDGTAKAWKVQGKQGAELSFQAVTADKFGDLFGYMFLKVPAPAFPPSQPLRLEVLGEDADSADWYMTFQHRFESTPRLRVEPVLLKDPAGPRQMLRLSLDNLVAGRTIQVRLPGQKMVESALDIAANILRLPIPAVTAETSLPVRFEINGSVLETSVLPVRPVHRRDIYLLSYSHNDIGYTDVQADVERKQWHNLDLALELIRRTRDYPPDARYRWNLEVIWALDTYLQQASEDKRKEIFATIREGSLGVNALYANMLTGLANSAEMSHFLDFARQLRDQNTVPITTAVTSDIPGFTWGIVSALAQSGVKYFAIAPNNGDRIGHTLEVWGDKPFYWVSQSGEEKVLAWVAGASYSSFHEGELSKLGDDKILKLARHLDETGYPYAIVHLPYTQGDNGPPDATLPDFVKQWNERYETPRLVIATHERMFRAFEQRYGSTLPMVKGDFTPYWEDGAASSARETALNRAAVDGLIQGEALWSMRAPQSYPAVEYAAAWRNAILWDEHTWGAHNSVTDPDLPFVKLQWHAKQQFALQADARSRTLLAKALPARPPASANTIAIDVYNTSSWTRTDLVLLPRELSSAGDRVVDQAGKPVHSQRLSTGELAVLAEDVAPLGARRILVKSGRAYSGGVAVARANTLQNRMIFVAVDGETGAIESLRATDGTDLAAGAGEPHLHQYEYVLGRNPANARTLANVNVTVKEPGPLVASLLITADAPGAKRFSSEVRVIDGLPRVDIIDTIDKQAVREKEGVHLAFPFNVAGGLVRYDVADGIVRAEADQLPGACRNFLSAQSWVDVSNDQHGIALALPDAPLVEVGGINAEQEWMTYIPHSPLVYSYVMNNYWHTNYKADQEGPVVFRYSLLPHGEFQPAAIVRFGSERRQPLFAAMADPAADPVRPLLQLSPADVVISSIRPVDGGRAWLLRLYNASDNAQDVALRWNQPATFRRSDPSGTPGALLENGWKMVPYGTAYVRVERRAN